MRLDDFTTIDEVVELGIIEFQKRSNAPTMNWMPSRQNVYTSQCHKYSEMLLIIGKTASKENIIEADMNPSQFVKAAQDFQLSARMAGVDRNVILENFIRLANIGMMLKRHFYGLYSKKIKSIELSEEPDIIVKANQLNGLLRAFSETVYFDDHTVSGEFYGDLKKDEKLIVVRAYKRLCPSDFLDRFDDFQVERLDTYCEYKSGRVDFDCLGNIQYIDQVRPEISGFYAECFMKNGDCVILNSVSAIDNIIKMLETQLNIVLMSFFSYDKYKKESLLLKSAYYAFKPIQEKLGFEWKPSETDIDLYLKSLQVKTEFDKTSEKLSFSKTEDNSNIRKIVDPRYRI